MAQSNVYSLNVVGYVNQTVHAGKWYIWGTPLANGDNTSASVLTNLTAASGHLGDWANATVYTFPYGSPDIFYYDVTESQTSDNFVGWYNAPNFLDLSPGVGYWFYAPCNGTVTFVGQVATTNKFNLTGGAWNIVASAFPAALPLADLGLQGSGPVSQTLGGDWIYRHSEAGYDAGTQFYNDPVDSFVGWWDNSVLGGGPLAGPTLGVGEGIWYNKWGSTAHWTQTFTIN